MRSLYMSSSNNYLIMLSSSVAVILMILLCFCTPGSGYRGMVGGRTEVKDVDSNEEVQDLGRFSIREYNRMQGATNGHLLIFSHVVEAERQVVAGIKYYLKIEARQHGKTRVFESVVLVQAWLHSKQLLDFSPLTRDRVFGF